jgi:hypothetical protein
MKRYLSAGLNPYSFKLHYQATQRNFITHYILKNFLELSWTRLGRLSDEEKYDVANAFLANFWYVADYKFCNDLIASLAAELEIPRYAAPKNSRSELEWGSQRWSTFEVQELPLNVASQIQRDNIIDQKLWETWCEARHGAAHIRPLALSGKSANTFIRTEAIRFVSQIRRRALRRWGLWTAAGLPAWGSAEAEVT